MQNYSIPRYFFFSTLKTYRRAQPTHPRTIREQNFDVAFSNGKIIDDWSFNNPKKRVSESPLHERIVISNPIHPTYTKRNGFTSDEYLQFRWHTRSFVYIFIYLHQINPFIFKCFSGQFHFEWFTNYFKIETLFK